MTKHRIWELDALRGLCILGMVVFHLIYDMTQLYRLVSWQLPPFWNAVQLAGGVVFVVLSGLCVTLGTHTLRRGAVVFGAGMLCTLVTAALAWPDPAGSSMVIRFGVLHCLGICMLLWALFRRLPTRVLAIVAIAILAAGWHFDSLTVSCRWLFPLGLTSPTFSSGDYFPLAPNFGWFLLGACLGRLLYKQKVSLLPKVNENLPPLRLLRFCGRHSLFIYLLHQPVLTGTLAFLRMIL